MTANMRPVLDMFDHARAHDWPISGGILQQSDTFLHAYEILDSMIPTRDDVLADAIHDLRRSLR